MGDDIEALWPNSNSFLNYVITIDVWGKRRKGRSQQQTTRHGLNLVVQLNFANDHQLFYNRLATGKKRPFEFDGHPIHKKGRKTLAWARLDLDLETGEVLIEEIQTDWIREVRLTHEYLKVDGCSTSACKLECEKEVFNHYVKNLDLHCKLWDQAILSAALWFSRSQLGIRRIWYHTFDTGNKLKGICYSLPPRSIYTDLPRRFGFAQTKTFPEFLTRDRNTTKRLKKLNEPRFFTIEL